MNKPVIGILGSFTPEGDAYFLRRGYTESLVRAGAIPVILPFELDEAQMNAILDRIDGLLISGGVDIDPSEYGAEREETCGKPCPERDATERTLIRLAHDRDIPMLGICRGMQAMNVYLGGTLVQDIPTHFETEVKHSQPEFYDICTHTVDIEDKWLESIVGARKFNVNSKHHQCVKTPGRNVRILARSTTDCVPEALRVEDMTFGLAVQWHPETLSHLYEGHQALFNTLVAACRKKAL